MRLCRKLGRLHWRSHGPQDLLLRASGISQSPARCLPRPRYTGKLDFLGDDFRWCFLRVPGIWQSLVQCLPRLRYTGKTDFLGRLAPGSQLICAYLACGFIWEMTSGSVSPIQHFPWFDSGYTFMPVYGALGKISHDFCVKVDLGSPR